MVAGLLLLALLGQVPGAEGAAVPSIKWKKTAFVLQSGDSVAAHKGSLRVPESRSGGSNRNLQLRVVRFRSTGNDPGPPVVLLEGGPGSSGLAQARGRRYELIELLRQFGDVLILDQRGVGDSSPALSCDQTTDIPLDREMTEEIWLQAVAEVSEECAGDWADAGTDLQSFHAEESAADVDALRQAVGADRIVLWGQSYGTLLALNVIRLFPEAVAGAILHGVLGPDHYVALPKTTDKILRAFGKHAGENQFPGMVGDLRDVLDRIESEPALVQTTDPRNGERVQYRMGRFELSLIIHFAVLGDHWLMQQLPGWVAQMKSGDFSSLAPLSREMRRWTPRALTMAVVCANGVTDRRQRKADRQAPSTVLRGLPSMAEICEPWGVDPLGALVFDLPESDIPVLMVSGTFDTVTPPGNASAVGRGFPNARYFTVVRGTHSDLVHGDDRIYIAVEEFMAGRAQSESRIVLDDWVF